MFVYNYLCTGLAALFQGPVQNKHVYLIRELKSFFFPSVSLSQLDMVVFYLFVCYWILCTLGTGKSWDAYKLSQVPRTLPHDSEQGVHMTDPNPPITMPRKGPCPEQWMAAVAGQGPASRGLRTNWRGRDMAGGRTILSQDSKPLAHCPITAHLQNTNSKINLLRISQWWPQSITCEEQWPLLSKGSVQLSWSHAQEALPASVFASFFAHHFSLHA